MVDVTTEALQTVKNALANFQSDIDGISIRSANNADDIIEECKVHIRQTKAEIARVEAQITVLNKQIIDLEAKIDQTTNQYNALLARIPQLENSIRSLDSKISALYLQVSSLRSKLANADDAGIRHQIQGQINNLMHQISKCETERNRTENELRDSEEKKNELQQVISSEKAQNEQCENELSVQKSRCNKMKDKHERLNTVYSRVEADLNAYIVATKKFEVNASERIQGNTSAVEKCMDSIERYLSLNIGTQSSNANRNTSSQIASGISYSAQVMSCRQGEYHYETGNNNLRHAFGQLSLVAQSERQRNQIAQSSAGGVRRRTDDDGGHLIGARFGGTPNSENLFPQNMHLNRSGYRALESQWANLLENNNQVFVDIYTSASSDQMREDTIYGSYTVVSLTGEQFTETFSFTNENTETQENWENDVFVND